MSTDMGVDFDNLRKAIDWSVKQLATPRMNRIEAIKQYVGSHYTNGGTERNVPTNFLEMAVTIYTRQLAAQAPRVMVTTGNVALRPFAKSAEIALNQIPDEIDLGATLQRAVIEALFSMGIVKVGISSSGREVLGHDVGEPYVDVVSIDDYFLDMSAKTRGNIQFEGNDYWLPIEDARALYDGKTSDLEPDEHTVTGDQGETRAESVSSDEGAELYKERVWLRDVWLSREGKLVTYGVKSLKVFNIIDWDGPEHSPYHTLGFSDVPGNLLPLPPVALWQDLHELGNKLFRKIGRQADNKKNVIAFPGGNEDSVKALKDAADGEGITYAGQAPTSLDVGAIDPQVLSVFLQVKDLFSYAAGNLDTLGGLAPATDTVGQDKLLSASANARIDFMREGTLKFTNGIFGSLAWYEWTDPVRERVVAKSVKGTNISISRIWSDETREGDFLDFNFQIDAFSMQSDTPASKMQKIREVLDGLVTPFLPMMEAQGGQLDFKVLVDLVSKLNNIPELSELIKFGEPPEQVPVQASGEAQPRAQNTKHTSERISRPGASRSGKDASLSQLLMGGKVQNAEAAAIGKPS